MFRVVLVEPEIPPNTGNVIRLCANTGCELHLIEPLGYRLEDRLLQRAGLDYHEYVRLQTHRDWAAFLHSAAPNPSRCFAFTVRGTVPLDRIAWQPQDCLIFGSETRGLKDAILQSFPPAQRVRLPMLPGQRSLNLSNAVAISVFEAWRQNFYQGAV